MSVALSEALREAAAEGKTDAIARLLCEGAPVDGADAAGRTALWYAASRNQPAAAAALLAAGAAPNGGPPAPLAEAAGIGAADVVSALLAAGADPNRGPPAPLTEAARSMSAETVRRLLAAGADPNGGGALHAAVGLGRADVAAALLAAGADPNARDGAGETPLMQAGCEVPIIRALLAHGADASARRLADGATALLVTCEAGFPELARELLASSSSAAGVHVDPVFWREMAVRHETADVRSELAAILGRAGASAEAATSSLPRRRGKLVLDSILGTTSSAPAPATPPKRLRPPGAQPARAAQLQSPPHSPPSPASPPVKRQDLKNALHAALESELVRLKRDQEQPVTEDQGEYELPPESAMTQMYYNCSFCEDDSGDMVAAADLVGIGDDDEGAFIQEEVSECVRLFRLHSICRAELEVEKTIKQAVLSVHTLLFCATHALRIQATRNPSALPTSSSDLHSRLTAFVRVCALGHEALQGTSRVAEIGDCLAVTSAIPELCAQTAVPLERLHGVLALAARQLAANTTTAVRRNARTLVRNFVDAVCDRHRRLQEAKRSFHKMIIAQLHEIADRVLVGDYTDVAEKYRSRIPCAPLCSVAVAPLEHLPRLVVMAQIAEELGGRPPQLLPLVSDFVPGSIGLDLNAMVVLLAPLLGDEEAMKVRQELRSRSVAKTEERDVIDEGIFQRFFDLSRVRLGGHSRCTHLITTNGFAASVHVVAPHVEKHERPLEAKSPWDGRLRSRPAGAGMYKCAHLDVGGLRCAAVDPGHRKPVVAAMRKTPEERERDDTAALNPQHRSNEGANRFIFFSYSRQQRADEMKTRNFEKQRRTVMARFKVDVDGAQRSVAELVASLRAFNGHSYNAADFLAFTKEKLCIFRLTFAFFASYKKELFRRLRWYSLWNKKRSEVRLVREFKNKFGGPDKVYIAWGDYGKHARNLRGSPASPSASIIRLFVDAGYIVLIVHEAYTSKMCCRCQHGACENEKFLKTFVSAPWKTKSREKKLVKWRAACRKAKAAGLPRPRPPWEHPPDPPLPPLADVPSLADAVSSGVASTDCAMSSAVASTSAAAVVPAVYHHAPGVVPRSLRPCCLCHGLLRCKVCGTLFDRDKNGAVNILEIAESTVAGNGRPLYLPVFDPNNRKRKAKGVVSKLGDDDEVIFHEDNMVVPPAPLLVLPAAPVSLSEAPALQKGRC